MRRPDDDRPGPRKRMRTEGPAKKQAKGNDSLSLKGQNLTSKLPDELVSHPNLHKLDLTEATIDKLSFLPPFSATLTLLNLSKVDGIASWKGLEQLGGLFVLNISDCRLTKLPKQVASLKSLKALVASHNDLDKLDYLDDLQQLNTIVVSHNKRLSKLPAALSKLRQLKKVSAAHCNLDDAGLPDLTPLAMLHELRLNDNRSLSRLPRHFGTWGKGESAGSRRQSSNGLEIVDLGNCAFGDWYALKEIAEQSNVVNLNIRGNPVVADFDAAENFDAYKVKMLVLLPELRVLDGHRFDAKFADLKAKRTQRDEAERILDAGPIAVARNASSANPIDLTEAERRRAATKKRPRSALPEAAKQDAVMEDARPEHKEAQETVERPEPAKTKQAKEKRKKKKEPDAEQLDTPAPTNDEQPEQNKVIYRKRGRKSRFLEQQGGVLPKLPRTPNEAGDDDDRAERTKRRKGPLLADLQGNDSDEDSSRALKQGFDAPDAKEDKPSQKAEDAKTSVVKVVQVKKSDRRDGPPLANVAELLKQSAPVAPVAGWD